MKKSMRLNKVFAGLCLMIACAILLEGCDSQMSDSGNLSNQTVDPAMSSAAKDNSNSLEKPSDLSGNQPVNNAPITKDNVRIYKSVAPTFSFEYSNDFKVASKNRGLRDKTGEIAFVVMELKDSDITVNGSEDMAALQLKPELTITVYEVDGDADINSRIKAEKTSGEIETVTVGGKTYLKVNSSGMVSSVTYFLVNDGLLYAINLKGYPAMFNDQKKNQIVNQGFQRVLETIELE